MDKMGSGITPHRPSTHATDLAGRLRQDANNQFENDA
jgi:hypothetical protein